MNVLKNNMVYSRVMDVGVRMLKIVIVLCVIWYLANFLSKLIVSPIDIMVKIGVMFALALPAILLTKPVWSFLALFFTRPLLEPLWQYRFLGGGSVLGIFSLIYIVIAVYLLLREKEFKILHDKIRWHYYFIIVAFVGLYNSTDVTTSITTITRYLTLLAIFLLAYNIPKNYEDALKIIRALVMSSVIPIIYGIYQAATGTGVQVYKEFQEMAGVARINSFYNLSNGFAYFLGIIGFLVMFCLYRSKSNKERIYYCILLLGALVCLLYTHTRTVWLAFFLGTCLLSIYDKKIRKYFVLIIIVAAPLTYNLMIERFTDLFVQPKYGTSSMEFRSNITKELLINAFPEHMIIGFGSGISEGIAEKYTRYNNMPHNDYMRILIENGMLGLVVYLIFIGKLILYLVKMVKEKIYVLENKIFIAILAFYVIASSGQNILINISGAGYIFCLSGLAMKINEIAIETGEFAFEK